ncbi:MAG: hypothetical protein M1831_001217 [Alyxoria varia]|nr:MAG: hypothetical protein M1831_001217 [Alyxoria varia]
MSTTTTTTTTRRTSPTHLRLSLSDDPTTSQTHSKQTQKLALDLTANTPMIPSLLSIPISPPASPLSPLDHNTQAPHFHPSLPTRKTNNRWRTLRGSAKPTTTTTPTTTTNPSHQPLPWLWQCHLCARVQPLGVSRRCLEDGHYFCSGAPQSPATPCADGNHHNNNGTGKKRRRSRRMNRACASEFDYAGWTEVGKLRREAIAKSAAEKKTSAAGRWKKALVARGAGRRSGVERKHNCWFQCDYPSECRWGKEMNPAHNREDDVRQSPNNGTGGTAVATSFEEILGLFSDTGSAEEDTEMDDVDMNDFPYHDGNQDLMDTDTDMDDEEAHSSGDESAKSQWSSSSSSSSASSASSASPSTSTTSLTPHPEHAGTTPTCSGEGVGASPLYYPREYDEQTGKGSKRQSFLNAVSAAGKKRVGGLLGPLGLGLGHGAT